MYKLSRIQCQLPIPDSMPMSLSKTNVLTGYQWQHTISWRPKINDSPKIMIHLLAAIKKDIAIICGCLSYYIDYYRMWNAAQDGAADQYVLVL